MTAYGAVLSLKNTIDYILHSSHFNLVEPFSHILQLAYEKLQPFQEILERLDITSKSSSRKKVNTLDVRIKEKIWEFEDKLESLVTSQIHSQDERLTTRSIRRRKKTGSGDRLRRIFNKPGSSLGERDDHVLLFSIHLRRLRDDVDSFIQTLKDMEKEYIYEIQNMRDDDDDECISTCIGFVGTKSKMIGLLDQFYEVKKVLMEGSQRHWIYTLVGMPGVGKTTLALKLFEDPEIYSYFECRVWVTVGRRCQFHQVSRGILAQLYGYSFIEGDENIGDQLKRKKCLIIMDDVWEREVLDSLLSFLSKIQLGYIQILATSRDENVIDGLELELTIYPCALVRFLDEEESKELLCEKVFGDKDLCPIELDKAATKIAKKCEGLPLTIVTVADILSKSQNREPKYWEEVAERRNSVFTDAYNQIAKVFFPSYDYLPQYLKMPFLYMGVFPLDYEAPPSKIINMLTAERWFLDANEYHSPEDSICGCLTELSTRRNLVLYKRKSNSVYALKFHYGMLKTCRLHSAWQYLCRREARKNKFYHVFNRLVDGIEEAQRCLCLETNMLFGITEFRDSVRLNCASSARSLLFLGPYQQYPIPIDVGFRLLWKLDALQLRFYTFPLEIVTLFHLKYLALTCNGELPTTISKLFNLQVLILHPHANIRYRGVPSNVPIQIWDMQELKHIEILGKSLVAPYHVVSLERLYTLVGVNTSISTILDLFKKVPFIRKLGVQIELTPYEDHNDLLSCFGCISKLKSLETLKCSVINPVAESRYVIPTTPCSLMLPQLLTKLHLSGMGFPGQYMKVIGSLRYLKVLKLRSYAFRDSDWELPRYSFLSLKFLLIEDSDLVQWKPSSESFCSLTYLSMRHCYRLKELHWPSVLSGKIELVDCNPLALTSANELLLKVHVTLDVIAFSTIYEKPMTVKLKRLGPKIAEPEGVEK